MHPPLGEVLLDDEPHAVAATIRAKASAVLKVLEVLRVLGVLLVLEVLLVFEVLRGAVVSRF